MFQYDELEIYSITYKLLTQNRIRCVMTVPNTTQLCYSHSVGHAMRGQFGVKLKEQYTYLLLVMG